MVVHRDRTEFGSDRGDRAIHVRSGLSNACRGAMRRAARLQTGNLAPDYGPNLQLESSPPERHSRQKECRVFGECHAKDMRRAA